jgi:hypothetical protein
MKTTCSPGLTTGLSGRAVKPASRGYFNFTASAAFER